MLEIGQLVDGKYKILNKVGQGGMSVVYLAMNEKANKQWAIKEVRKDGVKDFEVVKQGLVVETDLLKKLSHPNLPSIIDVIDEDDTFLIVMDYIEGNPLSKMIEEYGALPQDQVIDWAKQLCDVLGYLHTRERAIIYRDMKPANVMLKPDGKVTLIDFGTAREFKEKNLADTTCLGTVGYAAPEQFGGMGQTDARTDIYCLGATLYHLVTGKNPCEPPYQIRPIREINSSLSTGLEEIILRCTERNPEDRYQSCAELMYDLENYDKIDKSFKKKQRRKIALFSASVTLSILCGVVSVWGYTSAEKKLRENYNIQLTEAGSIEDYYDVMLLQPERKEAYEKLNEYLISDGVLSADEGNAIKQLLTGLNGEENGGSDRIDVLAELKNNNMQNYKSVCSMFGTSFLYYYDSKALLDRYANAATWLEEVREEDSMAEINCNLYKCLNTISQYRDSQVVQKTKENEQYPILWDNIVQLNNSVEKENPDEQLQAWKIINQMIYDSKTVTGLVKNVDTNEVKQLLNNISNNVDDFDRAVYGEEIDQLEVSIEDTIRKIDTEINAQGKDS